MLTLAFVSLNVTCGFSPPFTGVAGAQDEEVSLSCLLNLLEPPLTVEPSSADLSAFCPHLKQQALKYQGILEEQASDRMPRSMIEIWLGCFQNARDHDPRAPRRLTHRLNLIEPQGSNVHGLIVYPQKAKGFFLHKIHERSPAT